MSIDGFFIRVFLLTSPVMLLGLRANVMAESIRNSTSFLESERCVMVLFGEELSYVLQSNIVRYNVSLLR